MSPGTFGAAGKGRRVYGCRVPGCTSPSVYVNAKALEGLGGGCYLIHFDKPVRGKCQHYIGYAPNVGKRIQKHLDGQGSQLTRIAVRNGITFRVVKIWQDEGLNFKAQLKKRAEGPRLCHLCNKSRKRSPRRQSRGVPKGCPG